MPLHPVAIGALVAETFGLSRTSANRYLQRLEQEGLVSGAGKTSGRTYALKSLSNHAASIAITPDASESDVWRIEIEPHLKGVPDNILRICQYAFTEMFNNVIDHSASPSALISYEQDYARIRMIVRDYGVGIFQKVQSDFHLDDPRSALLELSKGKLTSDSTRHSGEGIFFTSRMFNRFSITSGDLRYARTLQDDWGWLIETESAGTYLNGTAVTMELETNAAWFPKDVFERYQNEDFDFAKTHVPVALCRYGQEHLVSRSQAKRILARFEKFEEVLLDFSGVEDIGQGFADEIFRVFALAHPSVRIVAVQASEDVRRMIAHARATLPSSPQVLF